MLNIAGPEYDYGNVVYVTLQECEHRRRGYDDEELEDALMGVARGKLAKIGEAYAEFGGSARYWADLEKEVLETAMPQYVAAAREMNRQERTAFGIWRGGDPLARLVFALLGIMISLVLLVVPLLRALEPFVALAMGAAGAMYPEIKRFTHERRHYRALNRLVTEAATYQQNARLHYMTQKDIRESFALGTGETGGRMKDEG